MQLSTIEADRLTLAIVGDLHCGSTVGLAPPQFRLDDGQIVQHSPFQARMWAAWMDYWQAVLAPGAPVVAIINGDLLDGDHHRTAQLFSRSIEQQRRMAVDVLRPIRDSVREMYIIRGTEAHAGGIGQDDESIAQVLGATPPGSGNASWWWLRLAVNGIGFDVAHHGPIGRLPWTRSNSLARLGIELELAYYRAGLQPPGWGVRSHNHMYSDSGTGGRVRVVALPCWQGPTAYGHRIAPGGMPDIGGGIWRICGEAVTFEPKIYTRQSAWTN